MLKYHVESTAFLKRLRMDNDGVVSFEYVIVAACIVAVVTVAFGTDATTGIGKAVADAIAAIAVKVASVVA